MHLSLSLSISLIAGKASTPSSELTDFNLMLCVIKQSLWFMSIEILLIDLSDHVILHKCRNVFFCMRGRAVSVDFETDSNAHHEWEKKK